MKRLGHKLLCWAGLLLGIIVVPSTVHANSITIMSTFGPNHLSDPTGGSLITNGPGLASITSAMPFTPTTLSTLYQIDIAVAYDTTDRSNAFSLALMTDNLGQPGSILESWSLTISFPILGCSHCFETVFSTQHPILQPGMQYWLVAFPGQDIYGLWQFSPLNVSGTTAYSIDGGKTWLLRQGSSFSAFDVRGSTSSVVPEPGTLVLIGSGLLGITAAGRRQIQRRPKSGFGKSVTSATAER